MKNSKKKPRSHKIDAKARELVSLTSNPVWKVFAAKPMAQERQLSVSVTLKTALYALTTGTGTSAQLSELVVTAHTAIVLAERGFGEDLLEYFLKSLLAAQQCRMRTMQGQPIKLTEFEVEDLNQLLDLHEQQIALTTKAELSSAIIEGYERLTNGKTRAFA